ncbi:putative trans-sialidase [Trypanosoma cruzi]|nr:putative trans-sialidase [Trypanosoma cruzi]
MSRRVFDSTVLLLLVVLMCCSGTATAEVENNADASNSVSALTGAITAEGSVSGGVEKLQRVDLFVPQTTLLQPKDGTVPVTTRDSFVSPSLVSAGGVIAAFAEGYMNAEYQCGQLSRPFSSGVVARCIDSVWDWSTVVGEVNKGYIDGTHCGLCSGGRGEFGCCAPPHNNRKGRQGVSSCGRHCLVLCSWEWERGQIRTKTGCW